MNPDKFIELEPGVFVSGQLTEADMLKARQQGIRSIVSNRPDEESSDHWSNDNVRMAAHNSGISFRAQPVWNFEITDDDSVRDFENLMRHLPRPILFYCRSGRRSTFLWAQASLTRLGLERIMQIAELAEQGREELLAILAERTERVAA